MTTRNLELNLRARADTKDIERLSKETLELAANLRKSGAAFDEASADARKLAQAYGQLSQEEREQIQGAARLATAVSQAATARERAAKAASESAAAESRALAVQQQAEQAAIRTATAEERLAATQANTAASVNRALQSEEKLAAERQRTFQATAKSEKAELDVARAREQLRSATIRAEQAEKRMAETRKSTGLATDIVRKQLQALVAGGLALQAGRQLVQFGRDSIAAASDAEEASAKFEQVFRDLSSGVRDELEVMADVNRRSVFDLISFASTLQDTFVPLGFAREEAAGLSKTITQLGIDIAAFSNKADAEVIQNLTSAIVGNHEAVRGYGIVLTETVLKQELARMGALELTGAQLEVAKAQARINIIMRSSADAQGAAVREADSYANTLKAFDAAVLELKVSLGEGLLPMMTDLAQQVIIIVNALNGQYAGSLLAANDANRKAGMSARELASDLRGVVDELLESGNALDKARISQGQIGNYKEVRNVFADIANQSGDLAEFEQLFNEIGLSTSYLNQEGQAWNLTAEQIIENFYNATVAASEYEAMLRGVAQADQAMLNSATIGGLDAQADTFDKAALSIEDFSDKAIRGLQRYADALAKTKTATEEARQAQILWNQAFGESFSGAPVGDLIQAQQDLQDATGEWEQTTVNNSGDIAAIQAQLAADLTSEQKAQLQAQLKDLDEFSADYLNIVRRLEGDLSDTDRLSLSDELAQLQGRQGQTVSTYTGDIKAAEEARAAIIEANRAIQDSYFERAYNSVAARLIEEGNFEQLAGLAVSLGIMSQEEANLRLEFAQTTAALDALTASTAFYGLTAEQQAGAIKAIAAGIYATADAAIKAQTALQATQDFYSTAPTSDEIGTYYTNLANQSGADEGISTTVSVVIDPGSEVEFRGFRTELEDYDTAIYKTDVDADTEETKRDFDKLYDRLGDLTDNVWLIKIKYETEGTPPQTNDNGGGGPTPVPRGRNDRSSRNGAYVDLTVNNYGSGDVSGAVKTGVLAAFRSLG